ncbi:MAG: ATP-binding cassette domain-containing protein [Bacteroidales bacterium]|nr:ATP-binding cassette domain-containing protein [Bacteroidales bacterium]
MLKVENISKSFGGQRVLDGVTFTANRGEVVGLLGRNGAGKTTLLRIVCGLLEADSGRVLFDDHVGVPKELIGNLPEERGLYRRMRAGEQALYLAQLKGMGRQEAEQSLRQWFDRLGMAEWWNTQASRLSKGMQQRLQFVVTVVHSPRLLVLDEPFSGFDADNADMLCREIQRLSADGTTVLLSTHNMQAAGQLCHKTIQL